MKYFFIAGEASGDLHASKLISALKIVDSEAHFSFLGGDLMSAASGERPIQHFREMNYMGYMAVLKNISSLSALLKRTKEEVLRYKPEVLILVDYAGFNLRIAKFASQHNIKVFYYISPKVWAWRKSRIKLLKKYIDKLFVIFPFEIEFFRKHDMEVEYHGNPLMDAVEEFSLNTAKEDTFISNNKLDDAPIVALLAGSRRQEIEKCLPEMIAASKYFPDYQFVVAGAPSLDSALYEKFLNDTSIKIVYGETYNLLSHARAAIVTSGTATLETALLNVPQIVVYKTGELTYGIGKLFINFEFFSLVNLIYGKELVKEILQSRLAERMQKELEKILYEEEVRLEIERGYEVIREEIGLPGVSKRIAEKMLELLS